MQNNENTPIGANLTLLKKGIEEIDGAMIQSAFDALTEAWQIINVLAMHTVDEGEPYPKALFWLEQNEQFKPHFNVEGLNW